MSTSEYCCQTDGSPFGSKLECETNWVCSSLFFLKKGQQSTCWKADIVVFAHAPVNYFGAPVRLLLSLWCAIQSAHYLWKPGRRNQICGSGQQGLIFLFSSCVACHKVRLVSAIQSKPTHGPPDFLLTALFLFCSLPSPLFSGILSTKNLAAGRRILKSTTYLCGKEMLH